MEIFSRRALGRKICGATDALFLSKSLQASDLAETQQQRAEGTARSFSPGFLWGSATAAYQVEGAACEGGRGPSIWDTFSHTPGKTYNGDTGDVADDFYHLYKQDITLMRELGLKAFRFSVSWTRIFPIGTGAVNQQGLDFYFRLTDALLEAGIEPYCTLYHWDLPQLLQDRGGWQNRDTAKAFADYAGYAAGKLSDRVKHFMTMNEMRTFVEQGYGDGTHAPGLRLDPKQLAQLTHYVILGHGLAVQAIRSRARLGTKVGIADNPIPAVPVIERPEHIGAAYRATREENAMYLTAIEEGRYTQLYLNRLGVAAPVFTSEEMAIISSPMDFIGVNVSQPKYVRVDDSEAGYAAVPRPNSIPHTLSPWLTIEPEAIYWSPKLVADLWKVKEIYVTENGASFDDQVAPEGHVSDTDRVMFLRNYLKQLQRCVSEEVPVKGYFLWSLLENFEWTDGYAKRFGIVHLDFKTQKLIPELSAGLLKEVIRTNRVV